MAKNKYTKGLIDFIKKSPVSYYAVSAAEQRLIGCGFTQLTDDGEWNLQSGGKYYIKRDGSSLIAFSFKDSKCGFAVVASHADSPTFKIKMSGSSSSGEYTILPCERYGGMILYSWLDRPLGAAGRVMVRKDGAIKSELVNFSRPVAVIPSVAIHLNRKVNDAFSPNLAKDMIPLISTEDTDFRTLLAKEVGAAREDVISYDMYLYVCEDGKSVGGNDEFIIAPRLDDLASVYSSLEAFVTSDGGNMNNLFALFDNEEIGSDTRRGAASTFLHDVLLKLSGSATQLAINVSHSLMISLDNAHAKHPNYPELSDKDNAPVLNGGIVIKHNANGRYTTDAVSYAAFSEICRKAGVNIQNYYNRADIPGGSTLGAIATTKVPLLTIDVGIAQLAMHSAVETAGARDIDSTVRAISSFYNSNIVVNDSEIIIK